MVSTHKAISILIASLLIFSLTSCKKIRQLRDQNPDLLVLEQGFKSSAAIGYCASLAHMVFTGAKLPPNVTSLSKNPGEFSGSALLHVNVNNTYPLPFNKNIGDIVIAALWDSQGKSGVMSIMFADIDILNADFRFYGIHTVPFIEERGTGDIISVFAQQDIIIGEGQDTIINLSMSRPMFNLETDRAHEPRPTDAFVAAKQNIWFVKVDQNDTNDDIYDDTYEISGGGQLAHASNDAGGIQYHALIETRFNYASCRNNPTSGTGFIQNLGVDTGIDVSNITLNFHNDCDGQAYVEFAAGKYLPYIRRDVNLNFD